MAERAVFLDRDNTIIENDGYLGDPSKVKLLTGAATALSAMRALGYRLLVVSNQSGVARGMFNEEAVEAVNEEMCRQLREQGGAHIDAQYYCPYHPEAPIAEFRMDHEWRKPRPGMLKQAATDFNLDLSQSWMIGDQPRDIAAGAAVGCRTILLRDPDRTPSDADPSSLDVSPNFIVKTLADAARIIAREGKVHAERAVANDAPPTTLPISAPVKEPERIEPSAVTQAVVSTDATPRDVAAVPLAAPVIDENALVEKLTERLVRHLPTGNTNAMNAPRIERALEDLVAQLRTQNRAAEAPPDFSRTKAAALLVQILALLAFVTGIYGLETAGSRFTDYLSVYLIFSNLQRATVWMLIAAVLQGLVIALLQASRTK